VSLDSSTSTLVPCILLQGSGISWSLYITGSQLFPRIRKRYYSHQTMVNPTSHYKIFMFPSSIPFIHHLTTRTMLSLKKSIATIFFLTATAAQAYSNPGACSGYCWAHDPAVIQRASDGTYFKFNTGTGIQYATASSLAGPWTIQGDVLPNGSSISNAGSDDPWVNMLQASF
jgi:hypothetical protein